MECLGIVKDKIANIWKGYFVNIPITQRRIFLIPITIVYAIILAVIAIVISRR